MVITEVSGLQLKAIVQHSFVVFLFKYTCFSMQEITLLIRCVLKREINKLCCTLRYLICSCLAQVLQINSGCFRQCLNYNKAVHTLFLLMFILLRTKIIWVVKPITTPSSKMSYLVS